MYRKGSHTIIFFIIRILSRLSGTSGTHPYFLCTGFSVNDKYDDTIPIINYYSLVNEENKSSNEKYLHIDYSDSNYEKYSEELKDFIDDIIYIE